MTCWDRRDLRNIINLRQEIHKESLHGLDLCNGVSRFPSPVLGDHLLSVHNPRLHLDLMPYHRHVVIVKSQMAVTSVHIPIISERTHERITSVFLLSVPDKTLCPPSKPVTQPLTFAVNRSSTNCLPQRGLFCQCPLQQPAKPIFSLSLAPPSPASTSSALHNAAVSSLLWSYKTWGTESEESTLSILVRLEGVAAVRTAEKGRHNRTAAEQNLESHQNQLVM